MSAIWSFLFYSLPWWVQTLLIMAVLAPIFYVAVRLIGWEKVKPYALGALGILAAIGAATQIRQSGYNDRKKQEEVARKDAEDAVDKKKIEVDKLPDDKLDERFNKW